MGAPASVSTAALSVVATVHDGAGVRRRFLRALTAGQHDPPSPEILMPYDSSIPETAAIPAEFPSVQPIVMGATDTVRSIDTAAGQYELYDRRRGRTWRCTGALVTILEDRAPSARLGAQLSLGRFE